jgi:hypothetical protein
MAVCGRAARAGKAAGRAALLDAQQRFHDYLRVSVVERCSLRCQVGGAVACRGCVSQLCAVLYA